MKKQIILFAAMLSIAACANQHKPKNDGGGGEIEYDEEVDIKVVVDEKRTLEFSVIAGGAVVNWGDGAVDTCRCSELPCILRHRYLHVGERSVSVVADSMTFFNLKVCDTCVKAHELRFADCAHLNAAFCSEQALQSLSLSGCDSLSILSCGTNKLKSLDVISCGALTYLNCGDNNLEMLNVTRNEKLMYLSCANNRLNYVDVSKCARLEYLDCSGNKLTRLNIEHNQNVNGINCSNNRLSAAELEKLFGDLPEAVEEEYRRVFIKGNDGARACNFTVAEDKGWDVSLWW